MRRWLRAAGLALAALVAFAVTAILAGAIVPRPFTPVADAPAAAPARTILVLANPIHTDIAFPADEDVRRRFRFLAESGLSVNDPRLAWVVVGWGSRAFYLETPTWSQLKPGPLARALTLDRSVMHVGFAGAIDAKADGVLALDVPASSFERMLDRSLAQFEHDASGRPLLIAGRQYGDYDRFYEARGVFNALLGCNVWASSVLRAGGLRTGLWNPLPQTLGWSLRTYNADALSGRQP